MEIPKRLSCCSNIRPSRTRQIRWKKIKYFHNHYNCVVYYYYVIFLYAFCLCLHTVFPGYPTATSLVSNTHQQSGYTPLHVASQKGNLKTVELLLQYKATLDKVAKVTKHLNNHYNCVVHACYISLCLCLHAVFPAYRTATSLVPTHTNRWGSRRYT